MQKALLQMNLQLSQVLTDITGETGFRIIRAIVNGERDPNKLAAMRNHRCKKDENEIAKALTGTWREEHLFVLAQSLELYDFYTEKISACDAQIEQNYSAIRPDWKNSEVAEQFSADPKASQPPVSNQASTTEQLKPLQDYLSDLAKAYPDVRQDASYQRIVGMLAGIEKAQNKQGASLTLVQVQQIRMQEAQAMAKISQDLGVLEKAFSQIDYLYPSALAAANPQFNQLKAQFLSGDMKTIKTIVVLKDDPYSTEAFENVRKIRSDIKAMGSEKSILEYQQAAVGGATAEFADVEDTINRDFIKIGALTIAGVLVILVLLLRSAIAPWYLVATVIFSYGATIGISTVLFQEVLGQTGISYFIPIILFVLLVALGADYNIFLISRIREEADKIGTKAGIQSASAATGGIITSAGIILAGTFAALALSPLQSLFQIGLAVAIGVLIDTFIIRAVLVPALASIFGEWNWWPHRTGIRLRKRVTEVGYEKGGS